jgi:syntaxin 1B/2/3
MSYQSYSQHGSNPYQMQTTQGSYEMSAYPARTVTVQPTTPSPLAYNEFLDRVSRIKTEILSLTSHVENLRKAHDQALNNPSSQATNSVESQASTISELASSLRGEIRELEIDAARHDNPSDTAGTKEGQVRVVKASFRSTLEEWQRVEREHRSRSREQARREWRIVRPDATDAEIEDALDDMEHGGQQQVFAEAIQRGARSAQAQSTLSAVRARHADIQQIERSLGQVAELFQQLNEMVVVQDYQTQQIEEGAFQTLQDAEAANKQLDQGIVNIKRRNKLRRWTLLIVVLIVLILALILGLYFGINKK